MPSTPYYRGGHQLTISEWPLKIGDSTIIPDPAEWRLVLVGIPLSVVNTVVCTVMPNHRGLHNRELLVISDNPVLGLEWHNTNGWIHRHCSSEASAVQALEVIRNILTGIPISNLDQMLGFVASVSAR